jgi:hypothetical protein
MSEKQSQQLVNYKSNSIKTSIHRVSSTHGNFFQGPLDRDIFYWPNHSRLSKAFQLVWPLFTNCKHSSLFLFVEHEWRWKSFIAWTPGRWWCRRCDVFEHLKTPKPEKQISCIYTCVVRDNVANKNVRDSCAKSSNVALALAPWAARYKHQINRVSKGSFTLAKMRVKKTVKNVF